MSWVRNHVRHFVLPGIRALARTGGRSGVVAPEPPPWNGRTRPSTKCELEELGLIYSTVASVLKKGDETRERALMLCRNLPLAGEQAVHGGEQVSVDAIKDLQQLWGIDVAKLLDADGRYDEWIDKYGAPRHDVMHAILCNSMRSLRRRVRKQGLQVVLPGRDVWAFEVMARRKRVPTIFDARVSRSVSGDLEACRKVASEWNVRDWKRTVVFDTGFRGSVWRDICKATGQSPGLLLLSADVNRYQLFPGHSGSRQKAIAFERLPKYWTRGSGYGGEATQHLSDLREFIDCALLTIWLWHHQSPRHIRPPKKPKPLKLPPKAPGAITLQANTWQGQDIVTAGNATTTIPPVMFQVVNTAGGGVGTVISNWHLAQNAATATGAVTNTFDDTTFTPIFGQGTGGIAWFDDGTTGGF